MKKFESVMDLIGNCTLVRIPPRRSARKGASLFADLELQLPGGMKDRVALQMIEEAERKGDLKPGDVIVESSSGTMGEGLARVAALKGYRVVIVTDPRIDEITKAKLLAFGAELEVVDVYDPVGGWQVSRLQRLFEVMARVPRCFWARQYDSPSNPAAYAKVAHAIYGSLNGKVAALVAAVGTGGSLCGVGRTLRNLIPDLKVVAVDAVGSVLFHQPNYKRLQSGHGNSVVPGNLNYSVIDEVHWVSDGEAFNGCRELARTAGVFAGGSSGAAYVVASWVAGQFPSDQNVVVIFPDRGDRYYASIYSDDFLRDNNIEEEIAGASPMEITYGSEIARRWSFASLPHDGSVPYHFGVRTTAEIADSLKLEMAAAQ
jgi:cysteine synthase A